MPTSLIDTPADETTIHRHIIRIVNADQSYSEPMYAEIELLGSDVVEDMHCYPFDRKVNQISVNFSQPGLYIPFKPFPNFNCLDSQTEKVIASFVIENQNQLVSLSSTTLNNLTHVRVMHSPEAPTLFPFEGTQYGISSTGKTISDEYEDESVEKFIDRLRLNELKIKN